jgi:hypothetical protein
MSVLRASYHYWCIVLYILTQQAWMAEQLRSDNSEFSINTGNRARLDLTALQARAATWNLEEVNGFICTKQYARIRTSQPPSILCSPCTVRFSSTATSAHRRSQLVGTPVAGYSYRYAAANTHCNHYCDWNAFTLAATALSVTYRRKDQKLVPGVISY